MSDDKQKTTEDKYKDTLNLPHTAFPMKANLASNELEILKKWQSLHLYQTLEEKNKNKPTYILHDGPPYANGDIHIGHALNHILKDMAVKSRLLMGFRAPYVPGWDCHGLPIELNVEKKIGKPGEKVDEKEFRKRCREYALSQIDAQRKSLVRLGLLGDFEHPYLTMDFKYEADIVRSLGIIIDNGYLHKGYKPVHWCIECRSALAEAEVEYRDKTSPSIDVCFDVLDNQQLPFKPAATNWTDKSVSFVIWTTTPWTLPANEAVAVHPEHSYVLLEIPYPEPQHKKRVVVAKELLPMILKRFSLEQTQAKILAECEGKLLEGIKLVHPFYEDRHVPVVLGEHVTLETGTGCVHTAPAHGQDDFVLGEKYHLPLENPVGSNGCYVPGTKLFAGQFVFKANDLIIELLKERHKLLHEEKLQHSYPHCWRHKTPLIFRATQQWFIGMDQNGLREKALSCIKTVEWIPTWGQARLEGMIKDRPDWCISRQRTWGVPLCLFTHKSTEELHPRTIQIIEQAAKLIEASGVDAWYDTPIETFLGEEAKDYEKSMDTRDVWYDSGVSHFCVLKKRPELSFPADLYLEGSDQHRGWFQSSLLSSTAMYGVAPYKQVLTHGFMVDADGHKMSKSLGNVLAPDKVVSTLGADVLRLWVSSVDYRAEIAVSEEILKRTSDTYRRIRNTARFLLSNLNGFDPEKDQVSGDKLLALDAWIVNRASALQQEINEAFTNYQFHLVYQKVHHFCSIDLGSFYLDVIKDRQYTGKKTGIGRRSAQTALYHIIEALVRWLMPILSFTAEEIWQYMPGKREFSVFASQWYESFPEIHKKEIVSDEFWEKILKIRDVVNKHLEEARAAGLIGSGLEAEVNLYCNPEYYDLLSKLKDELRFVLITSDAKIFAEEMKNNTAAVESSLSGLWLEVKPSTCTKCVRCWHRRSDVNSNVNFPLLCARCVENINGEGETRQYA